MLHAEVKPGEYVCVGDAFVRLDARQCTVRIGNCRASWGPVVDRVGNTVIRARFEIVDRSCSMTPVWFSPSKAPPEYRDRWPGDDPRKD